MASDPQDDCPCPMCAGVGKVECDIPCNADQCGRFGEGNECEKTHQIDCEFCGGSGEISGSAARAHRQEMREDADEAREQARRDDRI
jgi:hypothetical protein